MTNPRASVNKNDRTLSGAAFKTPWRSLYEIKMQRFPYTRKPGFQNRCETNRWRRSHGQPWIQETPARRVFVAYVVTRLNNGRADRR